VEVGVTCYICVPRHALSIFGAAQIWTTIYNECVPLREHALFHLL